MWQSDDFCDDDQQIDNRQNLDWFFYRACVWDKNFTQPSYPWLPNILYRCDKNHHGLCIIINNLGTKNLQDKNFAHDSSGQKVENFLQVTIFWYKGQPNTMQNAVHVHV